MKTDQKFDLEERTAKFSEMVIEFCNGIEETIINKPLISQLVRSSTSIGANYFEANGASSKQDFRNKIYICRKEARETGYWLRLITKSNPVVKEKADNLFAEVKQLMLIFSKIILSLEKRVVK